MTSASANRQIFQAKRLPPRRPVAGAWLAWALVFASTPALAQVIHPTPAEQAQHAVHAQQLRDKQQNHKLRQQLQQSINRTASKAYADQPALQKQIKHAARQRQRQTDARNRDLAKKIRQAEQPLPLHVEPAPAGSR